MEEKIIVLTVWIAIAVIVIGALCIDADDDERIGLAAVLIVAILIAIKSILS